MKILVLNGSPRPNGETAKMIAVFRESAEKNRPSCRLFQCLQDEYQRLSCL